MTTRRHPAPDPGVRRWGRALPWLLIGLGLGAHFLAFRAFVLREVAWGYPRLWDQAGVLAATYTVHHVLREHGLVGGLGLASMWTPPQGVLLHLEAALLMRVVGPSRLAALAILWLHVAAFLVLLAGTLRRLARGAWWPAMLGLGLMLAVASLRGFGGLADFRFDLSATCAYGAFLCLALRARTLAQPRGAALAGLMAGYLVALRHIAGVYVLLTLTALALLELRRAWRGPHADRQAARQRLRGVAWCLGTLALCAGPLLAWRLPSLRAYYWWGHVEAGAAHAALAGVHDATAAWLYYPGSLLADHAGPTFGVLALASLVIPGLARRHAASRQASIPHDAHDDLNAGRRLLLCALLMPLAALSADTAKSPIVAGVVMPAVVLLSCLPALRLARDTMSRTWHVAAYALGTSVLLTGLGFQFAWLRGPGPLQPRAESAAITDLYLAAARLCLERGQVNPVMLVDDASEYHVPAILTTLAYERYGRLIIARTPVGFPPQKRVDPVALRTTLGDADLALLSRGTAGPLFPYSQSLARYRADIDSVVARQLAPVTRAALASGPLELWAQPHPRLLLPVVPPVPGWAWIERQQGLVIEIPTRALRARPALLVQGRGRLDLLGGNFGDVRATLRLPDGRTWNVAASARVHGERYTLRAELAGGDLARLENTPARGQVVQIRFDFARSFRPSERGLGADSRELVTANPTHIELVRGSATATAEDATAPWPDLQPSAGLGVCAPGAVAHTARAARRPSGDLDGDGHPDLLWQDDRGRLLAWSLRDKRCLALRGERALSTWQRPVGVLDVDGDGRAELLFQDHDTGQLEQSALEGSQDLRIGEPTALGGMPVPRGWQAVGLGDVDGNGRSDVVGVDATGTLRALSIVGMRLEQGPRLDPPHPSPGWRLVSVFDLDGDGRADLLFGNEVSGRLVAWLMGAGGRRLAGLWVGPAPQPEGFRVAAAWSASGRESATLVLQRTREPAPALELWRLDARGRCTEVTRLPLANGAAWRVIGPR